MYSGESVDLTEDDDNEVPVDLSQNSRNNNSPEDILVFKSMDEKLQKVEELTNELKTEETALILLKKLKCSYDKNSSSFNSQKKDYQKFNNNINNQNNFMRQNMMQKQQQNKNQQNANNKNSNNVIKRSAYSQQNLPTNNNSYRSQSNMSNNKLQQYSNYLNNQAAKMNGVNSSQQQQKYFQEQQRKILQQQQQAAAIIVEQTAAQKLAAAKLAVNKQLEQSLQQLPSLVTTPFDLVLIPSANHYEYAASVGLDTVVHHLLNKHTPQNSPTTQNQCVSCKTDYTGKWITCKDGRVWCEVCYRKDKKKNVAKLQEERIGSLLLKAVTQEKNIEKALALELEAARQQIEAFNSTLATAVSTSHKSQSPINHQSLDLPQSRSSTPSSNKSRYQKNFNSDSFKNHHDLERMLKMKDKNLGNFLSLINPSAFQASSSHHTPLRNHKPYSRP